MAEAAQETAEPDLAKAEVLLDMMEPCPLTSYEASANPPDLGQKTLLTLNSGRAFRTRHQRQKDLPTRHPEDLRTRHQRQQDVATKTSQDEAPKTSQDQALMTSRDEGSKTSQDEERWRHDNRPRCYTWTIIHADPENLENPGNGPQNPGKRDALDFIQQTAWKLCHCQAAGTFGGVEG